MTSSKHPMNRTGRPFWMIASRGPAWLAALVLAGGCATERQVGDPTAGAVAADDVVHVVASSPSPADASPGSVRLRRGLVLGIKVIVAGKEEIAEPSKRISDTGRITLPMIGAVDTMDLPPDALAHQLEVEYGRYFVNPQVIVDVVKDERPDAMSPWGSVTVLGRVKTPGRVAIPPTRDLTVSAAIQRAGGFDTSARRTAIRVTHRASNGSATTREVNLEAVGARGESGRDLVLEADDVVFVPEMIF